MAVPAGYALARLRFRGAETLTIGIFLTYLVPTTLLFLPLVKVISFLGLFDKLAVADPGLSDVHDPVLHLADGRLLQDDPARDRGGGDGRRLLAAGRDPARHAAAEHGRHADGGDLRVHVEHAGLRLRADVRRRRRIEKVVTIGVVTELIRGDVFFWGSLMAGALIAGIPVAILYSFFLDYFVRGITGGAVK